MDKFSKNDNPTENYQNFMEDFASLVSYISLCGQRYVKIRALNAALDNIEKRSMQGGGYMGVDHGKCLDSCESRDAPIRFGRRAGPDPSDRSGLRGRA
ncbi:hypothetical protein [Sphingopyxis granuli]|jgi:hypothetical protein|uniref:hypothetical protein n=1 Tax=Sphingopyxis granuli TaxID=267128 RepID=UPI00146FE214|nr:hypothetical protein [Sphingopyxis granuli]